MRETPPKFATGLLKLFCNTDMVEDIAGDLEEEYVDNLVHMSVGKARRVYNWTVLRSFRPYLLKTNSYYHHNHLAMFQNILKVTWRNFYRHRMISLINLTGLTLGFACSLLLYLFVSHELRFDRHFEKADRIYRFTSAGNDFQVTFTPSPLAEAIKADFPEVIAATRLLNQSSIQLNFEEKSVLEQNYFWVDPDFFTLFEPEVLIGQRATIFEKPNSLVITKSMADKYYPDQNPLGQTIQTNNGVELEITGVIRDFPQTTHFHPNLLANFEAHPQVSEIWANNWLKTYFLLEKGTSIESVNAKIPSLRDKYLSEYPGINDNGGTYRAQALTSIHLNSDLRGEIEQNGSMRNVYILSSAALFILLLAAINFMNLTTAAISKRVKEIGMRKALGSQRKYLVGQFLVESAFYAYSSALIAVGLVSLVLPQFAQWVNRPLALTELLNPIHTINVFLLTTLIGLISGLYPALYLSSLNPIKSLKGLLPKAAFGNFIRKGLVIFQFGITIVLISGIIAIINQLEYISNKSLGFEKDGRVVLHLRGTAYDNNAALLEELRSNANISMAETSFHYPGNHRSDFAGRMHWMAGAGADDFTHTQGYFVGPNLADFMRLEVIEGRFFSDEIESDLENTYVINEAAARAFGIEGNAVGQTLYDRAPGDTARSAGQIIGVIKDFHTQNLRNEISPVVMYATNWPGNILIKVENEFSKTFAFIEQAYDRIAPGAIFDYSIIEDRLADQYDGEKRLARLINMFTILAIVIASLGLLGLVIFSTERRRKEIAIRKVLGASIATILRILANEFLLLIFIAIVIAVPVSWFFISDWLQTFQYHVNLNAVTFLIAGGLTIVISLLTMSYQSIRASSTNPVKTLRNE